MTETDSVNSIQKSAEALEKDIVKYMELQTEELSDTFDLVFKLNQAAIGKYSELIHEADALKEKAKSLQEQEIGIASFLSNLSVIEDDISKLEATITKLESYCTLLEQKVA